MNFRTIISFIVIAFISSLLNKSKTSTKPTVKIDEPVSRKSPSVDDVSDTTKGRKKGFSGGLEGLFEELRAELDKAQKGVEKEQPHPTDGETTREENGAKTKQRAHFPKDISIIDTEEVAGSVYEGEIGKGERYVRFSRKSIIQGIIMSEILQNPKVLRR